MAQLRYDKMVENALRGVLREALTLTVKQGLPGAHHFYITFRTRHPGVDIPEYLHSRHPEEMTIVLQHQFWGLEVNDEFFEVTLSFNRINERLHIPFAAVVAFADPSVKFGLQFQLEQGEALQSLQPVGESRPTPMTIERLASKTAEGNSAAKDGDKQPAGDGGSGQVITLDAFRKK